MPAASWPTLHQPFINPPSTHHQRSINAPTSHHQCSINAPTTHHQRSINAPSMHTLQRDAAKKVPAHMLWAFEIEIHSKGFELLSKYI